MIDPDKAVTCKLQSQFIYILCYMGSMITYCINVAFKLPKCCIFTAFSLGRRKDDSSHTGVAQKNTIILDWVWVDFSYWSPCPWTG